MGGTGAPFSAHGAFADGSPDAGAPATDGAHTTCGIGNRGGPPAGDAPADGGAFAAGACATQAPTGVPAANDLSSTNFKRKQEMDMDECVSLLRSRIQQFHPCNADWIIRYIIASKTLVEMKQYLLASDEQIQRLIIEAKAFGIPSMQFPLLTPPQPPSGGIDMSLIHWQPQFDPSGIQSIHHPVDQIRAFQSPFSGFIGLRENFSSLRIPGDGLPSNYEIFCQSVTRYPPSSSKKQIKPCHFHFSMGYCNKGGNCRFSHGSHSFEMTNMRQVHTIQSLPQLEKEISELLLSQRPPKVRIESLADVYIKRYGKPLKIEISCTEGQQHDHSFTDLLTMLCTTRVIERRGQCYIVPVEDAPKYLADDFKLVMPPTKNASNQIYITFGSKSTITVEAVWNYFSKYGPVSDVRIPLRKTRTFGYVSFLYPETAKRILSERSPMKPHLICGERVFAKAWKEKHELEKLAQKDAHSSSGAHKALGLSVIHENHTINNAAESSRVHSHWDEVPTIEDSDDLGLPGTLDDIY